MSAYATAQTPFKDAELLCEALRSLGLSEVLHNPIAQHLEGYHGDERPETAEIIIPRRVVGLASNDIGFKRNPDGTYGAIVSDYDRSTHYGEPWMRNLRNAYAEKFAMRQASRNGLRFAGKKVNAATGKIELQFLKA